MTHQNPSAAPEAQAHSPKRSRKLTPLQRILLLGLPAALLLIGILYYLFTGRVVSTDDAYVKANKTGISSEVTGQVVEVDVTDNSRVKAGQLLFRIDPRPFQYAVDQAQAKLDSARNTLDSLRVDYREKQAELEKAEETLRYQQHEYERFRNLAAAKAAPTADRDQAEHNRNDAQRARDALRLQVASLLAKLQGDPNIAAENYPDVQQAQAALDRARLDLAHTEVKAPTDGIASNVTLAPGEFAITAAPFFTVVNNNYIWVEANYKETQLTHVHPGQDADIKVDVYPGKVWKAVVASITPATGSEFSILPAQNSSGNWVKVVQRIMVRLELKPHKDLPPLGSGMSVTADIDTGANRLGRFFGAKDKGRIGDLAASPGAENSPPLLTPVSTQKEAPAP